MSDRENGPVMLVATEALRPPKLRIGKLGNNVTLPRTVPVASLLAGAAGALLSVLIFTSIVGWSVAKVAYSGVVGATIGVVLVTYSPLRGESLLKWFGLKVRSSRNRSRYVDGKPVRLAVGICYVPSVVKGMVSLRAGAVPVRPGLYDERGTRIRETRWALPDWFSERIRSAAPPPQEQPSRLAAYRSAGTAGSRLDAFRAASAESVIPEGYVPMAPDSGRRFGRWSQDGSSLQSMYYDTAYYETANDLPSDAEDLSAPFNQEDPL